MNTCWKRTTLLLSTALGLLVLPAAQASAQQTAAQPADSGSEVEEITVTAQKVEESSLDVPMGLTALSGAQLESHQSYRLEDFVGNVPGLNISETQGAQLAIRGIVSSSASINAPVATYIDETPLVGVGAFSGGNANTPNLDTFDLNRVEVLKGPQGTLYGANALGGLLKYVTNAPDPSGFDARVQGGVSTVAHSDDTGHALHGMINVPLTQDLAIRAVGYDNLYPGYIDDPARGAQDINQMHIYGGRAAIQWTPTNTFSLRFSALDQERRWDGMSFVDVNMNSLSPLTCSLCQGRDADQPGSSFLTFYNVLASWDLGSLTLTSSTTYDRWQFRQFQDLIGLNATADALKGAPGSGLWGVMVDFDYTGDEVVHETRLASNNTGFFNWQAGVYYTNKETDQNQTYLPIDRTAHSVQSTEFGGSDQPASYRELAGFGNLKFEITPTFDVSVGGRYSSQHQAFEQIGRVVAPSLPRAEADDDVFTYSADARWHVTPDSMFYARIASGFVPGGPNVAPFGVPPGTIPTTYSSSTTTNYEVGYKSAYLGNHLTLELSLFQINWEDIQLTQTFGIYNAIANGGTAVSRGVEWALNYVPVAGLTLGWTGSYTDAHLTEDTPNGGVDGDRLPITPRWQTAASVDYKWPMFGVNGFAGADWRYVGDRYADFTTGTRQQLPSYDIFDLRAGIETDTWTLGAFVKNVGDERAISFVGNETGLATQQRAYISTPRTIGVELTANF